MDVRVVVACDAASPGAARHLARTELSGFVASEVIDLVGLLMTELVTNAVVHARTEIEVRLMTTPHGVRVEVGDGNPALPIVRRPTGLGGTGRGLQLVEQLASRWGARESGRGKTVWFEIDEAAEESADSAAG